MDEAQLVSTQPKLFVFVLMPFEPSFDDVYKLGIKDACREAGAYCKRLDEQLFQETMLERIYNQISKADLIITDMTGRNPNVFYVVGYAHALGNRVILITKNGDDIPFDLKHHRHIVYAGRISDLKAELHRRVRWHVENPAESVSAREDSLEFFVNGQPLVDGMKQGFQVRRMSITPNESAPWTGRNIVGTELTVHNNDRKYAAAAYFCAVLIVRNAFPVCRSSSRDRDEVCNSVVLPGGLVSHTPFDEPGHMSPGSWATIPFRLEYEPVPGDAAELEDAIPEYPMVLRILSEEAPSRDISFACVLVHEKPEAPKRGRNLER